MRALIAPRGAELLSLVPAWGGEAIWQGEPSVWPWHAPNLFPVVGALAGGRLIHRGVSYPMDVHGFLRHSELTPIDRTSRSVSFLLIDSEVTRPHYPFPFRLAVSYSVEADRLTQSFLVENPGAEPLPVGLGGHPAFPWPIVSGTAREAHRLIFAKAEPQPIRRVVGGGLGPSAYPTPVEGRILALTDDLFTVSAVVWDRLNSRAVWFGLPDGPGVELRFDDFPHFGLWTRPGFPFLCLEPWQGYISPTGFDGEIFDRPGIVGIPPGGRRRWTFSIRPVRRLPRPE